MSKFLRGAAALFTVAGNAAGAVIAAAYHYVPSYAAAIIIVTVLLSALTAPVTALLARKRANPLPGCLLSVLSMPLYATFYEALRGMTHRARGTGLLTARHIPAGSHLYKALHGSLGARSFGIDLATNGVAAITASPVSLVVFVALVATTAVAGSLQQRLARRSGAQPQSANFAGALPALFALSGLALPVAVTLYGCTAAVFRLAHYAWLVRSGRLA